MVPQAICKDLEIKLLDVVTVNSVQCIGFRVSERICKFT